MDTSIYRQLRAHLWFAIMISCALACITLLTSCALPWQSSQICQVPTPPTVKLQVVDGRAFVWNSYTDSAAFQAINGAPLWTYRVVPSSRLVAVGQDAAYFETQTITAVRSSGGEVLWHFDQGAAAPASSNGPFEVGNTLYLNRGEDLYALDILSGHPRWTSPGAGSLLAQDSGILYLNLDGTLRALRGSDGRQLWSVREPGFDEGSTSWQFSAQGALVYLAIGPRMTAFNASDGREQWHTQADGSISAVTPVSNAQLAIVLATPSGDNELDMLRAHDGSILWHFHIPGGIFTEHQIMDGSVYLSVHIEAGGTQTLYALRVADGVQDWSAKPDPNSSSFLAADGVVYAYLPTGIEALRASDGRHLWTYPHIEPLLAAANHLLYIDDDSYSCTTNAPWMVTITALRGQDGKALWQVRI